MTAVTDPEATQTRIEIYYKRDRRPEDTVADYYRSVLEGLYHGLLNDRLGDFTEFAGHVNRYLDAGNKP